MLEREFHYADPSGPTVVALRIGCLLCPLSIDAAMSVTTHARYSPLANSSDKGLLEPWAAPLVVCVAACCSFVHANVFAL